MTRETWTNAKRTRPVAALELNALAAAGAFGRLDPSGLRLGARATPIHDPNGEVLFYRYPLARKDLAGWVDLAASPAFSEPLVAASFGAAWDPSAVIATARKALGRRRTPTEARIVAYSFPKLAVQFLANGQEVAMVEAFTGARVPRAERRDFRAEPPTNFERWSLLESLGRAKRNANQKQLDKRLDAWDDICPPSRWPKLAPKLDVITPYEFNRIFRPIFRAGTRELHYSTRDTDHSLCYEVRGQITNVWCVAASVQMLLDFYRYEYAQERVADELGLGTLQNPNGLPYSRVGDVVTVLEALSSNALTASMNTAPTWGEFVAEITANRPLISFVPGHSRTVAGYTFTQWFAWFRYRGLLVADPWPPTTGVLTRWENFANASYTHTYTAHVTLG